MNKGEHRQQKMGLRPPPKCTTTNRLVYKQLTNRQNITMSSSHNVIHHTPSPFSCNKELVAPMMGGADRESLTLSVANSCMTRADTS